jgi:hypothetical protein
MTYSKMFRIQQPDECTDIDYGQKRLVNFC